MIDFFVLGIVSDFQFVIQVFIMVAVISFILNHLGKGLLSIILILAMFYVIFILIPGLSEMVFLLYTLLMAGVSTLLVDFFFITGTGVGQQEQGQERPDVTGTDVQARREGLDKARHGGHQAVAGMMQALMRRGR